MYVHLVCFIRFKFFFGLQLSCFVLNSDFEKELYSIKLYFTVQNSSTVYKCAQDHFLVHSVISAQKNLPTFW